MPSLSEKSFKLMKKHAFCGSALGRLRLEFRLQISQGPKGRQGREPPEEGTPQGGRLWRALGERTRGRRKPQKIKCFKNNSETKSLPDKKQWFSEKNITVGRFKFQKIVFSVFQSKFPAKPKTKLSLFFGLKIKENEPALETTIAPCCCGSGAWVMIVFSHRCAKSIGSPLRGASVAQHCLGWFRTCPSARLAQSAERKALNLVVVGSSPTVGVLFCIGSVHSSWRPQRLQMDKLG